MPGMRLRRPHRPDDISRISYRQDDGQGRRLDLDPGSGLQYGGVKLKLSRRSAGTAPRPGPAVMVRALRKSFGNHLVLDGIDLDVTEGTVHALLGPNGSGKTTMVQILSTLLLADADQVRVAGYDVAAESGQVRAAIGVTGHFSAVDYLLTGKESCGSTASTR